MTSLIFKKLSHFPPAAKKTVAKRNMVAEGNHSNGSVSLGTSAQNVEPLFVTL